MGFIYQWGEEELNEFDKPIIDPKIICKSCKKFSGWETNDLIHVKKDIEIKCKHCKKVCIKIMTDTTINKWIDNESYIDSKPVKSLQNKFSAS